MRVHMISYEESLTDFGGDGMGLSGEDQRRIYEEDRVREEARGEIHRERKQKRTSLGSLGIFAIVLAIGLPAVLIGCSNSESTPQTTPQTTAEATAETATESAPASGSSLFDAARAKRPRESGGSGLAGGGSRPPKMLEFATLRERPLDGGGVGAAILVDEGSPKRDVKILGGYILWQVWPKKHFSVLVYNHKDAWEARGLCEQEHEGEPAAKFDEIEGGPVCTRATQLEKEHLVLTISRDPSTGQAESLWIGPDLPDVLSDTQ